MQQRCYLDYWRVYLSAGTNLIGADAKPVSGTQLLNPTGWSGQVEQFSGEKGAQVFAGLLMLPPQQSQQITLKVALPGQVLHQLSPKRLDYKLRVQMQPGLVSLLFSLEVTVPNDYSPLHLNEDWQEIGLNTWVWQGNLVKATVFTFSMQSNAKALEMGMD